MKSDDGYVRESARDIPVVGEYDICVIGGSCTGVFAAVAAARLGAAVAIVENNGFFGGSATAGLVNVWHSFYDTLSGKQIIGGLTAETVKRLQRQKAVAYRPDSATPWAAPMALNTAELAVELDEMITEAGIRPFLHARFTAPVMDGSRLKGVIIEDKTGRRAIKAGYFIDATGDGDLAERTGSETRIGSDLQPPTCCAHFRGISALEDKNPGFSMKKAIFNPEYPESLEEGHVWTKPVTGAPELTFVSGTCVHGANCSDADELTRAEIEGRRQARQIRKLLQNHFKGGEDVAITSLSSHIGIRETRKVNCLHRLTEEEILSGKSFPDAIANGTYPVDIHHSSGGGITWRYLDGREKYSPACGEPQLGRWRPEAGEPPAYYQIPYRSLVPRGADNILVAGRMIDTDRGAFGAVRVMVNTNQTGEAAGTAAYAALEAGVKADEIDPAVLRRMLSRQGAIML